MNRRAFLKLGAGASASLALNPIGLDRIAQDLWMKTVSVEPNLSYWARRPVPAVPALESDLQVDSVVVGAGLTGLSSALHLRRTLPGQSVAVLEARQVGNGGSGRSGGFLCSWPNGQEMMAVTGSPEHHVRGYQLTAQAMRELQQLSRGAALDAELELSGVLVLLKNSGLDWARSYVETAGALGLPIELWSRDEVRQTVGTDAAGGIYDPMGGLCQPRNLTLALKDAAVGAGVRLYENSPVVEIEHGDTVRVVLQNGRVVRARRLVLGTGAWTPQLGLFGDRVFSVSSFMGITPRLSRQQRATAGLERRVAFNDDRENLVYMGLTKDHRLALGGGFVRMALSDGTENNAHVRRALPKLERELAGFYPSLSGGAFEHAWGGSVNLTMDQAPSVGRTGRHGNVFYGVGYSGHGMVTAYLAGRVIAEMAAGRRGDWAGMPFVNRAMPYVPPEPLRWLGGNAYIAAIDILE